MVTHLYEIIKVEIFFVFFSFVASKTKSRQCNFCRNYFENIVISENFNCYLLGSMFQLGIIHDIVGKEMKSLLYHWLSFGCIWTALAQTWNQLNKLRSSIVIINDNSL